MACPWHFYSERLELVSRDSSTERAVLSAARLNSTLFTSPYLLQTLPARTAQSKEAQLSTHGVEP